MIMLFTASDRIFDTLADTRKFRASMKTKFYLRKDVIVGNQHPIYLRISGNKFPPERIRTDLYVEEKFWHVTNQRVLAVNGQYEDKNLILKNIESKITDIQTVYRLSGLVLTPKILRNEYENALSRVNFNAFLIEAIKEQRSLVSAGRMRHYDSVAQKLKEYCDYIPFNNLSISWFNKFRDHLKYKLENKDTTIAANFAIIKKFLIMADKYGIKLSFHIDDLYIGKTYGNRSYLSAAELKTCLEYYFDIKNNSTYRLVLGYFLFSCMNGLRISNVQGLNRKELLSNDISLILVKGNKDRNFILNKTAQKIVAFDERLFDVKYSDQFINEELKKIMIHLKITKKVSFHVARHTFATLYLKAGGKIQILQEILGHSSITETMIYYHITQAEANKEVFILDDFLNAV